MTNSGIDAIGDASKLMLSSMRQRTKIAPLILLLTFVSASVLAQREERSNHINALYRELYERYDNSHASARPTSDSVLTFLGRWPWGPCVAVAAKPGYAFITNGPMFQVLDVSDPANPTIVGEYEAWTSDIVVRDSVAFLAAGGLVILNISDPTNPTQLSHVPISSAVRVEVEGNFAYVLTATGVLRVVDIGNPSVPQLRGSISGVGGDVPRTLAVRNSHVYIGDRDLPRLSIVNATNPDSLWGRNIFPFGFVDCIFAADTLLYVGRAFQFRTFSISDPMNPVLLGSVNVGQLLTALTVDGTTAYITTDTAGIYAVDVSNPSQPVVIDSLRPTSPAIRTGVAITTAGENIFSAQYVGMWVVRKDSLREQSYFRTGEFATRVFLKDSLVYVADGQAGLWIVDISDPTRPQGMSNLNTGSRTCGIVVANSVAYVLNCTLPSEAPGSGLWIVDVSDPYNPNVLSHYQGIVRYSGTHANSISLVGNLVFVSQAGGASYDSTMEIIDVSVPTQPSRVSVFTSPYIPYYVAAKESIACLATPSGGLRIVDWSTPTAPLEVASFQNSIRGIALADTFAYAARSDTFFVLSLADPAFPRLLGKYGRMSPEGFTSANLFEAHPFIYWASIGSMGVIDVSDPTNPRPLTIVTGAYGVASSNDLVAAAVSALGVWIFRNDRVTEVGESDQMTLPREALLSQNYPNPFNSSTRISFSLPSRSSVILEVFDVLGRRIETLMNTVSESGNHTIVWDATSRSSGVYLYRLTAGATTITKPMVLIK